jgi:hypothetical protein
VPTGTVTWEAVITLWDNSQVTFYNTVRSIQGCAADTRRAVYKTENGVEIKVPYAILDFLRAHQGDSEQLAQLVTNAGDSNPALTELRGGVSATVSGLSGLTGFLQTELHPQGGSSKVDDIVARLQRIEDKVDALASS